MTERWLPVVGYEGLYEVSDFGRVRRAKTCPAYEAGHILQPFVSAYGYHIYRLSRSKADRRKFLGHRLVAAAFLGLCPRGYEVNHRDGVKTNNLLSNLEYVTHRENVRHARRTGLWCLGERRKDSILTADQVREIRRLAKEHPQTFVANKFGICQQHVSDIVRRIIWADVV